MAVRMIRRTDFGRRFGPMLNGREVFMLAPGWTVFRVRESRPHEAGRWGPWKRLDALKVVDSRP